MPQPCKQFGSFQFAKAFVTFQGNRFRLYAARTNHKSIVAFALFHVLRRSGHNHVVLQRIKRQAALVGPQQRPAVDVVGQRFAQVGVFQRQFRFGVIVGERI